MLVATHENRVHTILPPQLPTARVSGEVVQFEPTGWFAGTAALPNIHSLFEERSLAALTAQGIPRWLGRGGQMDRDGRLSFTAVSSLGFQVLSELSAANCGFHWKDDTGASWLVQPTNEDPYDSSRTAFALSWYGQSLLLDPQARRRATEALENRLAVVARPGHRWTAMERAVYAGWTHALRRLQLADLGMQILMALRDRAGSIELAAEDVERAAVTAAFDRAPLPSNEIWDAIRAATELRIAHLSLASLGWQPRIIRQSSAVSEVERIGPDTFGLQLSRRWQQVVAAFNAAKP